MAWKAKATTTDVQKFIAATLKCGNCPCEEVIHDEELCREFIIKQPKPSIMVFILSVIVLNLIGYHGEIYAQDHTILSAIVLVLLCLLLVNINIRIQQESLLVMGSVGVQYTVQFVSGRQKAEFMDQALVRDIVINEAITMHQVIYYLAILLEDKASAGTTVMPIFTHTLPRLHCLTRIYKSVHSIWGSASQNAAKS